MAKASISLASVFSLCLWSWRTAAYVPVPFDTSTYYGVDGPWQGVVVQVGGFDNGTVDSAQWTTVTMYPGGLYDTYALADGICTSNPSSSCGQGGLWSPGPFQTVNGDVISYQPSTYESGSELYVAGPVYAQNLNVGGSAGQSYTAPNASLIAVDTYCNRTLPNGNQIGCELGFLALGADDPQQTFSISTKTSHPGISTWNMPGYLYNTSATSSDSYTIHIGSTRYDYPGSLIFGGYDKGRAIGPATSWGDNAQQLLDVVIGVEDGGSPFEFDSKSGLLLDSSGSNNKVPIYPEPLEPYLHLPKQTCDGLAKLLPVEMDPNSGYYLWDTSDPSYEKITTAAAYLGFVFPPATGDTKDVTIKVPFQLLVLNLTEDASGRPGKIPYFPCMPYEPTSSDSGTAEVEGNSYILGRAFLQAALLGRNWNQHVSWLAQAPGPGPSNQGMGYQPQDIKDFDTVLQLYSEDKLFESSWSSYWRPLPGGSTGGQGGSSTHGSSHGGGLSAGAKIGIGVGVGVGVLAIIAIVIIILLFRRRDKRREKAYSVPTASPSGHGGMSQGTMSPSSQSTQVQAHYAPFHESPDNLNGSYGAYKPEQPADVTGNHIRVSSPTELPGHYPFGPPRSESPGIAL